MFLLRLKTEFAENLKLVLALWIALGVIAWSFFDWWLAPLAADRDQGVLGGFAALGIGTIVFALVSTLFKRDDLKHPQDFWATRPIRAHTLFGAKLVFVLLVAVLPMGLLMTLLGFVAGIGEQAIWHGLETMLWAGAVTGMLAASCMAFPGGGRSLLCMLAFFGGVILTSVILASEHTDRLLRPHWMIGPQMLWNLLVVLCLLTACLIWQCLRQIRDKHRRQQPLLYAVGGILAVLLIALAPLPGGLPNTPVKSEADTMPVVTKARLSQDNTNFGHRDGVAFASMKIELMPDHPFIADMVEFNDSDLRVTDPGGVPYHVEISHIRVSERDDMDAMPRTYPSLEYYVFEQQPGPRSGMSSGSDPEKAKLVASLPRRTIRITGMMRLTRIDHRVIHRGPLDRPFELRESGIRVAFTDSSDRLSNHDHSVIWKAYMPPLVTSLSRHHRDLVRFRVEHAASHGIDWHEQLEGSGFGGGAFFGPYRENELRIGDREIESDYHWRKLQERGYDKTVQEWKQEAELVCEVVDEVHPLVLPVDIEVEVPDPEKVRELLLKGEL